MNIAFCCLKNTRKPYISHPTSPVLMKQFYPSLAIQNLYRDNFSLGADKRLSSPVVGLVLQGVTYRVIVQQVALVSQIQLGLASSTQALIFFMRAAMVTGNDGIWDAALQTEFKMSE